MWPLPYPGVGIKNLGSFKQVKKPVSKVRRKQVYIFVQLKYAWKAL